MKWINTNLKYTCLEHELLGWKELLQHSKLYKQNMFIILKPCVDEKSYSHQ